jgi:hypothetical protein
LLADEPSGRLNLLAGADFLRRFAITETGLLHEFCETGGYRPSLAFSEPKTQTHIRIINELMVVTQMHMHIKIKRSQHVIHWKNL